MDIRMLEQLFAGQSGGDDDSGHARQSRPIKEAQVATLRELAARYGTEKPFKPGQIVTPRAGYNLRGAGEPFIVLEVRGFADAMQSDVEQHGTPSFGARLDIRTATLDTSTRGATAVLAYWNESWQFEPYTGPGADEAEGSADV